MGTTRVSVEALEAFCAAAMPGEMEWQRREQALAAGIALPEDVLVSLRGLAADSGLDPAQFGLHVGG